MGKVENVLSMKVTAEHSWVNINTTYSTAYGNDTGLSPVQQIKLSKDQGERLKEETQLEIALCTGR